MAFRSANRSNLFLNRKGHKGEWDPKRLKKLGNYLVRMGLISEVTKLPDNLFSGMNQAISSSGFWNVDNSANETEMNLVGKGLYVDQTDAAASLGKSLQDFFDAQSFPIIIAVNSIDPDSQKDAKVKFPVGKGHKLYPNDLVAGAEQAVEGSRFVMYIHLAPVDESFDPNDVDASAVGSKVARMIRHEIVHTQQFEKRRRKQKISRHAAKEKYTEEGEIPPDGAPRTQYLGAGIELDAYSHEFAEELLDLLGQQKALEVISSRFTVNELEKLGISDTLIEYLDQYSDAAFTKKLRTKIYAQMMDMIERGLYEGKNRSTILNINGRTVVAEIADCEMSRKKGLMNRLSLDSDAGMLFVFSKPKLQSFWMKETYLPLSIAYLDENGSIINISKMTPLDNKGIKSARPAKYALEMNEGWFERNGICVGDIVDINRSLKEMNIAESVMRNYIRSFLRETFLSHTNEPSVGDCVVNNNPQCKHSGSEGVVLSINSLPNDTGKTVSYECTNAGQSWDVGDVLEKTMDQLALKQ